MTLSAEPHLDWARGIAQGVAVDYGIGWDQEELEQVACLAVVERAKRFDWSRVPAGGDADGLFRGWVSRHVRKECQRAAQRLLNGGTYHTCRRPEEAAEAFLELPDDEVPGVLEFEERRRALEARREPGVPLPLSEDGTFRLHRAGLVVEGELELPQWAGAVGTLADRHEGLMWALGDLVLWGYQRFGRDARAMLGATGRNTHTVKVAAWVCRKFSASVRVSQLTFSHHLTVAALPPGEARALLLRARAEELTVPALRALVKARRPVAAHPPRALPFPVERVRAACERHGVDYAAVVRVLEELRGAA